MRKDKVDGALDAITAAVEELKAALQPDGIAAVALHGDVVSSEKFLPPAFSLSVTAFLTTAFAALRKSVTFRGSRWVSGTIDTMPLQ